MHDTLAGCRVSVFMGVGCTSWLWKTHEYSYRCTKYTLHLSIILALCMQQVQHGQTWEIGFYSFETLYNIMQVWQTFMIHALHRMRRIPYSRSTLTNGQLLHWSVAVSKNWFAPHADVWYVIANFDWLHAIGTRAATKHNVKVKQACRFIPSPIYCLLLGHRACSVASMFSCLAALAIWLNTTVFESQLCWSIYWWVYLTRS